MLKKITDKNEVLELIKDDPVRPHIDAEWRVTSKNSVYALFDSLGNLGAVVCVAFTDAIPTSELEMLNLVDASTAGTFAVLYTIWSKMSGMGADLVQLLPIRLVADNPELQRIVTLSPLTPMATNFHMRNGAKCIAINPTTQNFEYKVK